MEDRLFDWVVARLQPVVAQNPSDSFRVLHGRGQTQVGFEQINIDWFDPVLLITLYAQVDTFDLRKVLERVYQQFSNRISAILVQHRYLKESPTITEFGNLQPPYYARQQGLLFGLELGQQQNTGFFLDMEPGREWLKKNAAGKRVLNLFAFTCALSVVAVSAGAESVVNVDMSSRALSRGRDNHRLNDLPHEKSSYLKENILKSWGRIKRKGPFDIVIFDPPSYQKGSFIAERDYFKLVKRLPELCAQGCDILACLNAPELDESFIPNVFEAYSPECRLIKRLPMAPDFKDANPNKSLKIYHYQYSK